MTPVDSNTRSDSVTPDCCPTCGALPCDWAAGGVDAAASIEALMAERETDRININLKADFIDKIMNQLAQADQVIDAMIAKLKEVTDFYDLLPSKHAKGEAELLDSITDLIAKHQQFPTPPALEERRG